MNEATVATLTQRLDRLEQEVRWWRVGIMIGVLVGAAVLLGAASPSPSIADKLIAREFVLVDQSGTPQARLGVTFGKPELAFDDDPRALTLTSTTGTPIEPRMVLTDSVLAFTGKNRRLRINLGVFRQIDDLPFFLLHDEQGRTRIDLSVFQGGPSVIVQDTNKQARAILGYIGPEHFARGVTQQRPPSSLVLFDKDGKLIWTAP